MSDSRGGADSGLPTTIDTTVASEARVYDYWLGGRDNYPADRALGEEVAALIPGIRTMARANRAFVWRAVRYAIAEQGITQFLDIGTGIPTARNTHEVAQELDPSARIVYVDKDPVVLAHARALMGSTPQGRTAYIHADLHDPVSILTDPILTGTLDFDRPIALMLISVMIYFRDDEDDPRTIIERLLAALPPGSLIALSHPTGDFDPRAMAHVERAAEQAGLTFVARSRAEVETLFAGTDLVEPGVVSVVDWRPDLLDRPMPGFDPSTDTAWVWAGVGRKP
ncbi:SAM-dependent methyltransferase [Nocardia sp. NBC_01499]|uniref:SAM-dependent methyltransferase n=1 Tax=Nocardia sp. NBC_01499 TaxID=2903597 RepID=UPI00386B6C27